MDHKIKDLFLKYINGQCSGQELDEVIAFIKAGTHRAEWKAALSEDEMYVQASEGEGDLTDTDADRIYAAIENRLFVQDNVRPLHVHKRRSALWRLTSSAAAILILMIGGYLFLNRARTTQTTPAQAIRVRPGGNKAFLTLSNGKKISLTDAANGNIAAQSGIKIVKTADGKLIYSDESKAPENGSAQYNTVETPRGGQYQIRLPDGTFVWLNAASKMIYPVTFNGNKERRVELEGEAYFEVASDKSHPFIVKTGKQEVTVLGTHFNINGYKDESAISTTLLEGRVKARDLSSGKACVLSPGQQSTIFKEDRAISVGYVNTDKIVSWKNGYFIFDNQELTSIMKIISRWYDVDVEYRGAGTAERFGGTFSRSSELADILKVLKILGKVDFKIEGRTVVVSH